MTDETTTPIEGTPDEETSTENPVTPVVPGAMVYIQTESGPVYEFDLPLSDVMMDQLKSGRIRQVADADGTPITIVPTEPVAVNVDGTSSGESLQTTTTGVPALPGLPTERPAKSAGKADWVNWAVANGMPIDDAQALNKDQLIDQFGLITVAP